MLSTVMTWSARTSGLHVVCVHVSGDISIDNIDKIAWYYLYNVYSA